MSNSEFAKFADDELTRLDQISREVCNRFGNSDFFGTVHTLSKVNNEVESAVVAIMSADWMSPEIRKSFIRFLQFQAVSFRG